MYVGPSIRDHGYEVVSPAAPLMPARRAFPDMSSDKTTKSTQAAAAAREKRRHPRTRKYGEQQIVIRRVDSPSDTIQAGLWDFSYGGLGMEMDKPLVIGEEIELSADLLSPDYSMRVEGTGRIVHCRSVGRDRFRVGVAFLSVSYHRIDPEQ